MSLKITRITEEEKNKNRQDKTKVIRADLLDFDFDFEDIGMFGKTASTLARPTDVRNGFCRRSGHVTCSKLSPFQESSTISATSDTRETDWPGHYLVQAWPKPWAQEYW